MTPHSMMFLLTIILPVVLVVVVDVCIIVEIMKKVCSRVAWQRWLILMSVCAVSGWLWDVLGSHELFVFLVPIVLLFFLPQIRFGLYALNLCRPENPWHLSNGHVLVLFLLSPIGIGVWFGVMVSICNSLAPLRY